MWSPSASVATTTSASVLAPRLIVNEPAIGQRSAVTDRRIGIGAAMMWTGRDDLDRLSRPSQVSG
jgi:hypothetical protein